VLVLRILVPSLRTALRDKMAALDQKVAAEQEAARRKAREQSAQQAPASLVGSMTAISAASALPPATDKASTTHVLDLDGVSCAPLLNGKELTEWSFRCDGMTYPARLVNLPCPVEVLKTLDHATYYKSSDVGQILIVYEDMTHLEESESVPGYKVEGYPSYYPSGLTPPMKRVVERRFNAREHKSVAPPRSEIAEVERELKSLIDRTEKGSGKGRGKGAGVGQGKPIEEVVDDVVDYEPWMTDYGRQPYGITFEEKDTIAAKHPEIWLDAKDLEEEVVTPGITAAEAAAAASAKRLDPSGSGGKKSKKNKDGKERKKKKKKDKEAVDQSPSTEEKQFKKGIPSLKTREKQAAEAAAAAAAANVANVAGAATNTQDIDEVTQAAMANMGEENDDDLLAFEKLFDFDGDDTFAGMDLS